MSEHVVLEVRADAYEADVYAWTRAQAELMRARRFDMIDIVNVVEEIESLGNEQVHAVESHLIKTAVHLLKLAVSRDKAPRSGWIATVREQRRQLDRRLKKSPSLRRQVPILLMEAWPDIVEEASDGLRREVERDAVNEMVPYGERQILDRDFFPGD